VVHPYSLIWKNRLRTASIDQWRFARHPSLPRSVQMRRPPKSRSLPKARHSGKQRHGCSFSMLVAIRHRPRFTISTGAAAFRPATQTPITPSVWKEVESDESDVIQGWWPDCGGANRPKYNRDKLHYPSDLTDQEWSHVAPLISPAKHGGRKRKFDVREVINGIMDVLSPGCQWRYVPKDLPPTSTLFDDGTLENIHPALYVKCREAMGREASPAACVIDS
jgi:transposase